MTDITSKQIVEADMRALYIGNLNTVEFDLTLPDKGPNGSLITWESGHPAFLEDNGKIHRPPYGTGPRTIDLSAEFRYGEVSARKVYQVRILEEIPEIAVERVYPIEIHAEAGHPVYLPAAVILKTKNGEILSHSVIWEDGSLRCFAALGDYSFCGTVEKLGVKVSGTAHVVTKLQPETADTTCRIVPFDMGETVLDSKGSFYQAQKEMETFLLAQDADKMLYSFREACGLDTRGASPMTGWDSPESLLRGHTTGHFLSGLALCYKAVKNREIFEKAVYMIDALEECQNCFTENMPDNPGFLSAYTEEQFDLLEEYVPYPKIWAPYYTLHKILAGLLECYESAGIQKALHIAEKLGTWTYHRLRRLPREQLMKMWGMYIAGEFGGMNEVMAELYLLTKNEIFLQTAKFFDNDKLFIPMERHINALNKLHANQHIPQVIGAMKIFEAAGEKRYYEIAKNFWKMAVESHSYVIGGVGEGEMFRQPGCIAGTLSKNTAESCASYNMLKLTKELYKYQPDVSYMNYYERTLINHILASKEHSASGESTYFFPLAPGFKREFEHENSCCHGTGMESHFKYAENIFWHDKDDIYLNLFISSEVCWKEKEIVIHQTVSEAAPGNIELEVKNTSPFNLFVRIPDWAVSYQVSVDGNEADTEEKNGYLMLNKAPGTSNINLLFACRFYLEYTKDDPNMCSLKYGPYVLAALTEENLAKLPFTNENVNESLKKEGLDFYYNKIHFIPVWKLNEERYQVYFKTKE